MHSVNVFFPLSILSSSAFLVPALRVLLLCSRRASKCILFVIYSVAVFLQSFLNASVSFSNFSFTLPKLSFCVCNPPGLPVVFAFGYFSLLKHDTTFKKFMPTAGKVQLLKKQKLQINVMGVEFWLPALKSDML